MKTSLLKGLGVFKDDECDKIHNDVDDETLNTDMGKTTFSVIGSPTSERLVATTLAVTEGSCGYCRRGQGGDLGQGPTPVTMNSLRKKASDYSMDLMCRFHSVVNPFSQRI